MNTIFGYWRCSTDAQDQERQIRSLKDAGVEVLKGDKITGTSDYSDRKELSKLLDEIKEGDLLILDELSRLGRTMVTMLVEVNKLLDKGVKIRTLDGRLDTTTMNKEIINLIVGVMGYSAEMELTNIRRRTAEGRAVAKSRGVKFGAKRKYDQSHNLLIHQRRIKTTIKSFDVDPTLNKVIHFDQHGDHCPSKTSHVLQNQEIILLK